MTTSRQLAIHYGIDHKKLKKALMRENKFPNEEVKAEVIKLVCNGQDGSLSTASDNPTQNPPSKCGS